MKMSTAFPSKYLKAADLEDRDRSVVMTHVDMEDINDTDNKPVLYFDKVEKGLVLNKTNSKIIAKTYGDETDSWRGKTIVLYPAMVEFKGDLVEAIRVRVPKTQSKTLPEHNELNPPIDDDIPF